MRSNGEDGQLRETGSQFWRSRVVMVFYDFIYARHGEQGTIGSSQIDTFKYRCCSCPEVELVPAGFRAEGKVHHR